jgi:C1A family cysteine protease
VEIKKTKRYGWRPDLPDVRDFKLAIAPPQTLPTSVDLRKPYMGYHGFSKIEDQLDLGSCTANAIAGAMEYLEKRSDPTPTNLSRLFIYYHERAMIGTVQEDSGAYIRDGIKVVHQTGAPAEKWWPYDVRRFTDFPNIAPERAAAHKAVMYERMTPTLSAIKSVLASGVPFVFGFTVYENFEGGAIESTGQMFMPDGDVIGGHAVCAAGYDDTTQRVTVRNSWGTGWGDQGFFYMPYAYITNTDLCDDFWVIRR